MLKYLEKTLYFGLGLVTYSAEKVEGLVNELVKKGEVASEDAKKLVSELIEKGESQKETIRGFIQDEMKKASDKAAARKDSSLSKDDIREMIREELSKFNNPDIIDEEEKKEEE